jgi:hypothetical protein
VWQLQDFPVLEPKPTAGKQVRSSLPIIIPNLFLTAEQPLPAAVLTNQWGSNMTCLSAGRVITTEFIFLLEMKQGKCVWPPSWSVHCNFTGDGKYNERGWACTPPPSPAWANFTLMSECAPESSRCYSVYSVVITKKWCWSWGGGGGGGWNVGVYDP